MLNIFVIQMNMHSNLEDVEQSVLVAKVPLDL